MENIKDPWSPSTTKMSAAETIGISPEHEDLARHIVKLRKNPLINNFMALGQGLGEAVNSALRTAYAGVQVPAQYKKGLPLAKPVDVSIPRMPQFARPTTAAKISEFTGRALPYMVAPEAIPEEVAATGAKIAPLATEAIARRAAQTGLYGATQAPGAPIKGFEAGVALSPLADIAGTAVGGAAKTIISPKAALQRIMRGGFSKDMHPYIKSRINAIMTDLKGNSSPETSNEDIYNLIDKNYGDTTTKENDLYSNLNNIDPKWKKAYDRSQYDNVLDKNIAKTRATIKQLGPDNVLSAPVKEQQNILMGYKSARLGDFSDADSLKRFTNDHIRQLQYGDPLRSTLHDIKEGVRNSVEDSVKKSSGSSELMNEWRGADNFVKNDVIPFRETPDKAQSPFIKRFKGKKDISGLTNDYVKPSAQKDPTERLNNLLKITGTGDGRKLVAYDLFKDVEDDPTAYMNRYAKYGLKQRQALFPEHQEELDQLLKLKKQYPKAFTEATAWGPGRRTRVLGESLLGGYGLEEAIRHREPGFLGLGLLPLAAEVGGAKLMGTRGMSEFAARELPVGRLKGLLRSYGPAIRRGTQRGILGAYLTGRGQQ